jgi:hypothetical protein
MNAKQTKTYTDGNDYSDLKVNDNEHLNFEGCVACGSMNVTILDDKDICHDCGYIYE